MSKERVVMSGPIQDGSRSSTERQRREAARIFRKQERERRNRIATDANRDFENAFITLSLYLKHCRCSSTVTPVKDTEGWTLVCDNADCFMSFGPDRRYSNTLQLIVAWNLFV